MNGQLGKHLKALKGSSDSESCPQVGGFAFQGHSVKHHRARIGTDLAADAVEESCLPGSVRSNEPDGFSAFNREVHLAHCGDTPEGLCDALCDQQRTWSTQELAIDQSRWTPPESIRRRQTTSHVRHSWSPFGPRPR